MAAETISNMGRMSGGAPDVFIDDSQFAKLWMQPERYYLSELSPLFLVLKNWSEPTGSLL